MLYISFVDIFAEAQRVIAERPPRGRAERQLRGTQPRGRREAPQHRRLASQAVGLHIRPALSSLEVVVVANILASRAMRAPPPQRELARCTPTLPHCCTRYHCLGARGNRGRGLRARRGALPDGALLLPRRRPLRRPRQTCPPPVPSRRGDDTRDLLAIAHIALSLSLSLSLSL